MASDSVPIPVRITQAELVSVRAHADAAGQSLAQHVRAKLGLPPPKIGRPAKEIRKRGDAGGPIPSRASKMGRPKGQ